ncbi:MAG: hypothetical protein HYV02_04460 [Deltaproteobacteria bacterium]|nr:hypothetical protein [Deltaproteobacteria bacterium]
MYRQWIAGVVGMVLVCGWGGMAMADGCYLCEGGGYVTYTGDDTFARRKKAKEQFGCVVVGTTSSCSQSKGTVSFLKWPAPITIAVTDIQSGD